MRNDLVERKLYGYTARCDKDGYVYQLTKDGVYGLFEPYVWLDIYNCYSNVCGVYRIDYLRRKVKDGTVSIKQVTG